MNKTLNIGLAGYSFMIDEQAYLKLNDYLAALRNSLEADEADEVMHDIEIRMVEIFRELLGKREVINSEDVDVVIAQIGRPEIINEQEEIYYSQNTAHTDNESKTRQLFRDGTNMKIAGVCSGLAHYFGIDVSWMRIIWLVIALIGIVSAGISTTLIVLLYIALWAVLPKAETASDFLRMKGRPINFDTLKEESGRVVNFANSSTQKVQEMYRESQPILRSTGSGLWNVIRYAIGIFAALLGTVLLSGGIGAVALGYIDTDSWSLPGNSIFILSDYNLKYALMAVIFLATFLPALAFILIAVKMFSPKTTFKNLGYVFGALFVMLLSCSIFFGLSIAKHKAQLTGYNEEVTNISIPATGDSLIIQGYDVKREGNFIKMGKNFYHNGKIIHELSVPEVKIQRKDSVFQPYLSVEQNVQGYGLGLNTTVPVRVEGNTVYLPNAIQYPFADRFRNHYINYKLIVPKNMKIIRGANRNFTLLNYESATGQGDKVTLDIKGKKWVIQETDDEDSILINGKKYDAATGEKILDSLDIDLSDLASLQIDVNKGSNHVQVKTGK